jgi:DNA-binding transcriptional MerR regulator/uncharacterized glyoxalase superfamily protein PhnB
MADEAKGMKVGELARAAGLSIRTVRYYDQIGLLSPSQRSAAGHRLYDDANIRRLYRICLLRRTGLSLAGITHALDDPGWDLAQAMRAHLELLDRQVAAGQALRRRVARMREALTGDDTPATTEFLDTLEEMNMLDDALRTRVSILVYDDIPAVHSHLVGVLGLGEGRLEYDGDGNCVHGEVHAGDGVIWLHTASARFGLASPKTLGGANGITAVMVDDVDAHHARAVEAGAEIVYPPVDQPYGYREYSARDPEGGLWSFMKPLDG